MTADRLLLPAEVADARLEAAALYVDAHPCANQSRAGDACGSCVSCRLWSAIAHPRAGVV